jgi:hypothetical protein
MRAHVLVVQDERARALIRDRGASLHYRTVRIARLGMGIMHEPPCEEVVPEHPFHK